MSKVLIVANWKMNPVAEKEAYILTRELKKAATGKKNVDIVLCPPAIYLATVKQAIGRVGSLSLGAQDMSWQEKGARTGQISPLMLHDVGAKFVILGHSELREMGETDESVNKKIRTALAHKLTPIVCIGERERDENGFYLGVVHKQVEDALQGVPKKDYQSIIFAYEPIWAIGKTADQAVTPHELYQMSLYIKKVVADLSSKTLAMSVRVIYGGSVEAQNTGALLSGGGVEGFLVGHASMVPSEFREIIKIAETSDMLTSHNQS